MRSFSVLFRTTGSCVLLAAALAASQPAHAFADDDARKAILELRQQIKSMTDANQRSRLQLADQIDGLEQEITRLRGMVEQLGRPGGASASAGGAQAEDKAEDPREQSAYDGAMEQFRKGEYKESSDSLMAFLTLYPESNLAPSAMFYLGSSRYALKDYKGAIDRLTLLSQKFASHPRAPDALLVIAGSQIEMNNRAGAKVTLQRIVKDYKGTPAADTAAKRLQLLQ